jgi:hypothetical protein
MSIVVRDAFADHDIPAANQAVADWAEMAAEIAIKAGTTWSRLDREIQL